MENIETVDLAVQERNAISADTISGDIALEVLKQDETDIGAEGLSEEVTVH